MLDIQKPRCLIDLKNAVVTGLTVVMLCMFQVMILPAMAQYTCGLQSGKYANYDWSMTYSAMGQSFSMSGTLDVDIQSVSGSSYSGTFEETVTGGSLPTDILNITESNQTFSGDVGLGSGITGFIDPLAIPANMTAGNSIPGVGSVQQIGSWGGRSAVVVNSSGLGLGEGSWYYDQTTGIFLSATTTVSSESLYSLNYKLEMVGTDLWSGGLGGGSPRGLDPWIWAVIIVIIVATVAAIAAVTVMRRKKQPTAPTPASLQPPPPPAPPPA